MWITFFIRFDLIYLWTIEASKLSKLYIGIYIDFLQVHAEKGKKKNLYVQKRDFAFERFDASIRIGATSGKR